VQGTLHWVNAKDALNVEVRLYDRLFTKADLDDLEEGTGFLDFINPNSLKVLENSKAEASMASAEIGSRYQFEREGYFCVDLESSAERIIFNRTVPLRDTWAKIENAQKNPA
jgi:glutaminyl-tRNA synthetase